MGSVVGAITGHSNAKSENKANAAYAAELNGVRNQIRDAYAEAQKGWVDYIPELQQGISGNINFANQIAGRNSAYNNYLGNEAANSLGLGYRKATESIAPQLEGETYNLIKQTRDELIPAARSAAIDAGAYGGSRDYLTRERVQENLEIRLLLRLRQTLQIRGHKPQHFLVPMPTRLAITSTPAQRQITCSSMQPINSNRPIWPKLITCGIWLWPMVVRWAQVRRPIINKPILGLLDFKVDIMAWARI